MTNYEQYKTVAEAEEAFARFCKRQYEKARSCRTCPFAGPASRYSCRVLWLYAETSIGEIKNESNSNTSRNMD